MGQEELNTEELENNEPQYTEEQELAVSQGWNPDKEAWVTAGNDLEDFKSARTWIREGQMMDRIEKQNKALDRSKERVSKIEGTLQKNAQHTAKLLKYEKDRLTKQLKKY